MSELTGDFEKDSMHWRGKVLTGKFAHWCWDWDGLPVDETTPEWESCHCEFDDEVTRATCGEEGS